VVGSGPAGSVIARELSIAGFSVLVLEQGPRLNPSDFEHDELKYNFLHGITNDPQSNPQTFRRDEASTAARRLGENPLVYARIVGGSSNHFTANYWRFHEIDFNERSVLGAIAGTGFADWPLSYQDLEPYYTRVEWDVGVSGLAGASPFDPPRTKALSDAAPAGEILRGATGAWCPQARTEAFSCPHGHQLTALS